MEDEYAQLIAAFVSATSQQLCSDVTRRCTHTNCDDVTVTVVYWIMFVKQVHLPVNVVSQLSEVVQYVSISFVIMIQTVSMT